MSHYSGIIPSWMNLLGVVSSPMTRDYVLLMSSSERHSLYLSLTELRLCVSPQVEEPYDAERCLIYPMQLDLDLDRDLGDEESFDVEDCKIFLTCFLFSTLTEQKQPFAVCHAALVCVLCVQWTRVQSLPCVWPVRETKPPSTSGSLASRRATPSWVRSLLCFVWILVPGSCRGLTESQAAQAGLTQSHSLKKNLRLLWKRNWRGARGWNCDQQPGSVFKTLRDIPSIQWLVVEGLVHSESSTLYPTAQHHQTLNILVGSGVK